MNPIRGAPHGYFKKRSEKNGVPPQRPKQEGSNGIKKASTSWEGSADWYDALLEGKSGTYQTEVILPNLIRVLNLAKGEQVLDLACGQGFFSRAYKATGATVTAVDISPSLIRLARSHDKSGIMYHVAPAHKLGFLKDGSVETVTIVLALQNMENPDAVLAECARVLAPGGRVALVLNHPAFRIPKQSDWGYDTEKGIQYRRVDSYLSQSKIKIDMHPGKKNSEHTISFHHSLQSYFKMFRKAGFAATRLEEWISHKTSAKGSRQKAEDVARKEIPIFMYLELRKIA